LRKVLVNGVFDIIHVGHIELLKFSRGLGDHLVVAIDSDSRVKSIKGNSRPFHSFVDRKTVLMSIRYVDEVLCFSSLEDLRSIHASLRPDFLVKGSDWDEKLLREQDGVLPETEIVIFDRIGSYSTTSAVEYIIKNEGSLK